MDVSNGTYEYEGVEFVVTRTSPDSVTVGLECDKHDHEGYIVGRIEGQRGWGVGRRDSGHPHEDDSFQDAVQHCATMLAEECDSMDAVEQVDNFLTFEVVPPLKDRLDALVEFLERFESPTFEFGQSTATPGRMPFFSYSDEASRFIQVCYDMKWVHPFDWGEWMRSSEAVRLRDEPGALESATPDQLQRLLTTVIRQDRFVDGAVAGAYKSGLLIRILRRAAVLAEDPEVTGQDDMDSSDPDHGDSS